MGNLYHKCNFFVGYLEANFASLIYTAFVKLESDWRQLIVDIRNGYVCESLQIDEEIREKLNGELTPDPERADELEVWTKAPIQILSNYTQIH